MPVKATGKEWKEYYSEEWPPDAYHEGEELNINGEALLAEEQLDDMKDTDLVVLKGGVIVLDDGGTERSFEDHFRTWKKHQALETHNVTIPKGKLRELKAAIKPMKGKVLT